MDACEIPRWQVLKSQITNLDPDDFRQRLQETEGGILVDVRTVSEVLEYTLPGSYHIDYLGGDFLDQLEVMDRNITYFIYCRTGRRSMRTGVLMHNWGFKNLINLEGGLAAWEQVFGHQLNK